MSAFALVQSFQRLTSDQRMIRWWECELHDGPEISRPVRPFWSESDAEAWAAARGYEVRPQ